MVSFSYVTDVHVLYVYTCHILSYYYQLIILCKVDVLHPKTIEHWTI